MTNCKLTPIRILLSIALVVLIPVSFYYLVLASDGGMGLAGFLAGICSIVLIIILLVERAILRQGNYRPSSIWIIESVIILLFLFAYALTNSTFYFRVSDNVNWFVIIESEGKTSKQAKYDLPFNKMLIIDANEVIKISSKDIANRTTGIKANGNLWKGYKTNSDSFEKNGDTVEYTIYTHYDYVLKDTDSVVISKGLNRLN